MYDVHTLIMGDWELRERFGSLERAVEFVTARKRAEWPKRWRVVDEAGRVVHVAG